MLVKRRSRYDLWVQNCSPIQLRNIADIPLTFIYESSFIGLLILDRGCGLLQRLERAMIRIKARYVAAYEDF